MTASPHSENSNLSSQKYLFPDDSHPNCPDHTTYEILKPHHNSTAALNHVHPKSNSSNHLQQPSEAKILADELLEEKIRTELEENSHPFLISKILVNMPYLVIGVVTCLVIICGILIFTQGYLTISEENERTYFVYHQKITQRYDAQIQAEKEIEKINQDSNTPLQSQEIEDWRVYLLFRTTNSDTIFQPLKITQMQQVEQNLMGVKDFNSFCLLDQATGVCANDMIQTLTPYMEGKTEVEMQYMISTMVADPNNRYFFHKDTTVDNPKSKITRAIFKMAAPIEFNGERYENKADNFEEQEDEYTTFLARMFDFCEDLSIAGLEVYLFTADLWNIIFNRLLIHDYAFAGISFGFVFCYVTFHLRSIFFSFFGMIQILYSFVVSLLIYKGIYGITFYSALHILAVFIILGISADNFFVFTDAWNQYAVFPEIKKDLHKRMALTFRRAVKAISVTSSTTAVAFLATGLSDIMPIASFGFFASTIIIINFLFTILLYPSLLSIHGKYIEEKICTKQSLLNKLHKMCKCCFSKVAPTEAINDQKKQKETQTVEKPKSLVELNNNFGKIEKFFDEYWNLWIFKSRYILILLILAWIGVCIYFASNLSTPTEQEKYLPDDNYFNKGFKMIREDFYQGVDDRAIKVYIIWGVKGIDRDDVDRFDVEDRGKVMWDSDFSIDSEEKQNYFIQICDSLEVKITKYYSLLLYRVMNMFCRSMGQ